MVTSVASFVKPEISTKSSAPLRGTTKGNPFDD